MSYMIMSCCDRAEKYFATSLVCGKKRGLLCNLYYILIERTVEFFDCTGQKCFILVITRKTDKLYLQTT